MAKAAAAKHDNDNSRNGGQKKTARRKRAVREILFPTEPTSIDPARIDEAIERVMARRRK